MGSSLGRQGAARLPLSTWKEIRYNLFLFFLFLLCVHHVIFPLSWNVPHRMNMHVGQKHQLIESWKGARKVREEGRQLSCVNPSTADYSLLAQINFWLSVRDKVTHLFLPLLAFLTCAFASVCLSYFPSLRLLYWHDWRVEQLLLIKLQTAVQT